MRLKEVKVLNLGLTTACNGKCLMCWHSNSVTHHDYEIDYKIYAQVRDGLFKHIKLLRICGGGEFTFYSKINEFLEDLKKYKFKSKITTNFSCITPEQRQLLKDIDVDFIVSIDGSTKELNDKLRPGCSFDKLVENVKFFRKCGKRVDFQTTVSEENFYDMDNIMALAERLDVQSVFVQELQYFSGLEKPYKLHKPKVDQQYLNRVFNSRKNTTDINTVYRKNSVLFKAWKRIFPDKYCPGTADSLVIQEDGRVLSCCVPYSKVMGDLHKNSIEEIIGSAKFESNRVSCSCPMRKKDFLCLS